MLGGDYAGIPQPLQMLGGDELFQVSGYSHIHYSPEAFIFNISIPNLLADERSFTLYDTANHWPAVVNMCVIL